MKKMLAVLVAVLMLQAGTLFAQDKVVKQTDDELKKILADLNQCAAKAMVGWKIPGMSIGIVQDGKLIFAKGLYNFDFCVHFTSNIFTSNILMSLICFTSNHANLNPV